ncbi:MAG: DUF934 domain-containing protein [Myxococcota bacterium]
MALLEKREVGAAIVEDRFLRVEDDADLPEAGDVLVSLERFTSEKEALIARPGALGVLLRPEQPVGELAKDLDKIALIALDFPVFSDGRAYSSARLLRERYGYQGQLRAVGDVLCEQIDFMLRSGFDAFEMASEKAVEEFARVEREIKVVYQATGDGLTTATELRSGGTS